MKATTVTLSSKRQSVFPQDWCERASLAVSDPVFENYGCLAWRVKEQEGLPGDTEPFLRLIPEHASWVVPEPLRPLLPIRHKGFFPVKAEP